jgi:hypothetical protein
LNNEQLRSQRLDPMLAYSRLKIPRRSAHCLQVRGAAQRREIAALSSRLADVEAIRAEVDALRQALAISGAASLSRGIGIKTFPTIGERTALGR